MRILTYHVLAAFLFVLASCSDPGQSINPAAETNLADSSTTNIEPSVEAEVSKPLFPRLNNENCVEFLLEYGAKHLENRVLIKTTYGEIELELYSETPIHRANFLYLIERNYYNPTEILRVVKNFVVQGGNSEEVEPAQKRFLIGEYSLPAEFHPSAIHLKGALAMSRNYANNPEKRSSAYDFYIVHGRKISAAEIYEAKKKRSYTDAQLEEYKTIGGAIHLDEEHTVFGRMVRGWEVLETIANAEVDEGNWPRKYIEVRMEIL